MFRINSSDGCYDGIRLLGLRIFISDINRVIFLLQEETFGPVVGIMSVSSDDEAIKLMNDSPYGLTASVWTDATNSESEAAFLRIVDEVATGTVFLNRLVPCDLYAVSDFH